MAELCDLTASELGSKLRAEEISPTEIVESCLARIAAVEDQVKAFLTVTDGLARQQASEAGEWLKTGEELPAVAGIPLALKDVLTTKGITTTCGSRILHNYVPPYDCTPWLRLKSEGSVLIGKTNCDEFAMGSSTENSGFFPTRNPWGLETVPGGSSGGSAAAVAAGESVWALGTDTGGSVRQPAALCGIVGLKPTYGLVSRYGLIAFASSLDHVGTLTRSVRDAAVLLQSIAGHDPSDATSLSEPVPDYVAELDRGVDGLRVGVVMEGFGRGVQDAVASSVRAAIDRFVGLGAKVEEVSLPHTDYALSAGYYEAYYGQAQKVRTLVIRDYEQAFERFDVVVSPTSPTTAFQIGERTEDPLSMYLADVFTIPADLAGVPAISVPCGTDGAGLPVGLQLTAPVLGEATILRAAHAFEKDLGFSAAPPLLASLGN